MKKRQSSPGLLRTFAGVKGVLREKDLYAPHLKGKDGKLYIVGKVNNGRFREKI